MEFRRSKTIELSSQGYSDREIATILKVNDTAVHRDLAYLRKQAQNNLEHHIHNVIPMELERCMVGIKGI
jgi:DNA-directed RNA polymerase specialized sigma24 family protein